MVMKLNTAVLLPPHESRKYLSFLYEVYTVMCTEVMSSAIFPDLSPVYLPTMILVHI